MCFPSAALITETWGGPCPFLSPAYGMDSKGRPSLETREELQKVLTREEASQGSGLNVGNGEKGPQEYEAGRVGVVQQAGAFLLLTGVWLTLGRLELGGWGHSQDRHLSLHQDLSGPKRPKVTSPT